MKRIAFLISDTGGGHRAAGRAIDAALSIRYPGEFEAVFVDVFREYGSGPMRRAPEIYPRWIQKSVETYGWNFWVMNQVLRIPWMRTILPRLIGTKVLRGIVRDHRPDILVVLHGGFSILVGFAREHLGLSIPLVTVVTDLAKPHVGWYSAKVDRCLVPCRAAYDRARKVGVPDEKLRLVGHPAHPKFASLNADRAAARAELGWVPDLPAVMILGGGDGMGGLEAIVREVDARSLPAQLAVICGRNAELERRLKASELGSRSHIYGFVGNIEVMMRASDVLVTKAGPGTIAEAAIMGLPMILAGGIPHQETPNIAFVVDAGAGVRAERPQTIADVLERWLAPGSVAREGCAEAAKRIAFPRATFDIAGEVAALCGV